MEIPRYFPGTSLVYISEVHHSPWCPVYVFSARHGADNGCMRLYVRYYADGGGGAP